LGRLVETILHKGVHTSLMSGVDLVGRCKKTKLILRDKRSYLWDVAFLFVRET